MSIEPLLLVAHGKSPVSLILPGTPEYLRSGGVVYDKFVFECPANVSITLFETAGKIFERNDGAIITNLLSQINYHNPGKIDKFLTSAHEKKIMLEGVMKKEYYGKKYTSGDIVPNIFFKLEDPETQLGLFNLKNDAGAHIVELDDGPQWDISHDADPNGIILGPKKIVKSQHPRGKGLFVYKNTKQTLADIIKRMSKLTPKDVGIDLIIISCRGLTSEKLEIVGDNLQKTMDAHYMASSEYNHVFSKMNNLITECSTLPGGIDPKILAKVTAEKEKLDKNIDELIKELLQMLILTKTGYDEFREFTLNIALEDHLNNKPFLALPTDMNIYVPISPGNMKTRALNGLQDGGSITYKRRQSIRKKYSKNKGSKLTLPKPKKHANTNNWVQAVSKARKELNIKGFTPIKKGTNFYKRAKIIHEKGKNNT